MKKQSKRNEKSKKEVFVRFGTYVQRRSSTIIGVTILITLLMFIPLFFLVPTERASSNPGGEVFDVSEEVGDKFPPSVHQIYFVAEAKDNDILTKKELWELYQNENNLRESEFGKKYLYERFDIESGTMTFGVYTIADAVQSFFLANSIFGVTLETATDDQVKLAIHYVISDPNSTSLSDFFSQKANHKPGIVLGQPIEIWTSPGFMFPVNINNSKIPKEASTGLAAGTAGGVEHQKINREAQDLLRGGEKSYGLWGIAIDLDLESEEEGMLSIPLIIAAIVLIIIIVTIQFRSGKVAILTIFGLLMLIIWLKGFSNLLGLKSSLTLDIILPVAILVLGVDYVIHAVHRYREESKFEDDPGNALANSVAGVGGALTLAMLTTVVAFMSNISSGIEDTRGFGIAATVAIISAFFIMGLFVPAVKMRWDARQVKKKKNSTSANNPAKKPESSSSQISKNDEKKTNQHGTLLSRTVCYVADKKAVTIIIMVILTIIAGYYAIKLETKMDAKEFLDTNSDFVISLDKMDEHVGEAGGEPATILIKGDLSEPEALDAIQDLIDNMADDKTLARRNNDSEIFVVAQIFDFLEDVLNSNVTKIKIETNTGISIPDVEDYTDLNQEQLRAIFNHIFEYGIDLNETALIYEPSRIKESFYHNPSVPNEDATIVRVFIPGTREQSVVRDSKNEILDDMKALENVDSIISTGLTGPGYERLATLDAITDTLTTSIIIAVILCFVILLIAFRSLKYAMVTIIPVMLVALWLYAIMYLTGFHLNIVTATIAAISIGVGVDYSVHITARYRMERRVIQDKMVAMEKTARGSGAALFGSAMSTFFGFLILAFAPMPMFSSFGILTALMILMAFLAALWVLPSMLILVDRK